MENSSPILNQNFANRIFLVGSFCFWFFFLSTLWLYYITLFWSVKFLLRSMLVVSLVLPWGKDCFSLIAFKLLFLSWTFDILMCLCVDLFGFNFLGTLWIFWIWAFVSFSRLEKFSTTIQIILTHFSLSSPSWVPIIQMIFCLMSHSPIN